MKRFFISFFGLLVILFANAQSPVFFHLSASGNFVSDKGENFIVVDFENKSAHNLYQMVASNIANTFNDPSKVFSGVDDTSIKVRAYCPDLCTKKLLLTFPGGGYYQLFFQFKDNKIRVSAPYIESTVEYNTNPPSYGDFYDIVKKWYNKKGEIKEKNKADVLRVEAKMNVILNSILGLGSADQEDW